MNAVDDRVDFAAFKFCVDTLSKERVAGLVFEIHHALLRVTRHLHTLYTICINDFLHECTRLWRYVLKPSNVDLVDNKQSRLSRKQGFDGVE